MCRICGGKLPEKPLLLYLNMPKGAQHFPSAEEALNEHGIDLVFSQCNYCGLIQLLGEPVSYYRDVIRAVSISDEIKAFRTKQFKCFFEDYNLIGKRVVEIGAGTGEYMKIAGSLGVEIYGIENHVQQNWKHIFQGYVDNENYIIPESPYDAFYCMNFLEHVPNPSMFLRGIYHNLEDEAVGLVEVPNMDMILEKALFSELIQDHLMYFSKRTLSQALELNGFDVISCKPIWHDYILSAIIQKRRHINIAPFEKCQKHISKSIKSYIEQKRVEGKKVAVWGAGHQALTILALTGIENDISCVIDSAVFKQNKLTPVTHIPVIAPRTITEHKIGAVLVMAAAYSDEIIGIMRRDYPNIDVAVLRDTYVEII